MLLNAYCTVRSLPTLSFAHVLRGRRDRSDPELAEHLDGFAGFVMRGGERPMNATRFHVLQHLGRVRHHLALEVTESELGAFEAWATEANALVFTTDGCVRTPRRAVLVAADTGNAQGGAEVPYPPDAIERRARTMVDLDVMGVHVPASLPPVVATTEVELRSAEAVAHRCLALFLCAVRAESLASHQPIPIEDLRARRPLGFANLSPKERAFCEAAAPADRDVVQFAWGYEAVATLAWAIGILPRLGAATGICDVPALAAAMFAHDDATHVSRARLRPEAEILDALDLHYRLHWATTEARVRKRERPAGLDGGVVFERHRALNWLTRHQEADWDAVDTAT